jgi:hypothetical protein
VIKRLKVQGQPGQKAKTPSQPIKVEDGGTDLSSQLCRKYKKKDRRPYQPWHKCETLFEK